MSINFKYRYNPLSEAGLEYYVTEDSKFTGICSDYSNSPACQMVLVPNKPPFPRKDQFQLNWKVLDTDNKSYQIVQICLNIDFMGMKYSTDTI